MKIIFVITQTAPNVKPLADTFLERIVKGLQRVVDNAMPIIMLPYGYDLKILNIDGSEVDEVTVRYEDANGNEISRFPIWK